MSMYYCFSNHHIYLLAYWRWLHQKRNIDACLWNEILFFCWCSFDQWGSFLYFFNIMTNLMNCLLIVYKLISLNFFNNFLLDFFKPRKYYMQTKEQNKYKNHYVRVNSKRTWNSRVTNVSVWIFVIYTYRHVASQYLELSCSSKLFRLEKIIRYLK